MRSSCSASALLDGALHGLQVSRGRGGGQPDRKAGASRSAADVDASAHRARELVDDRETEPGADGTGSRIAGVEEEALEGVRDLVGMQPRPLVFDREHAGPRDDAYGTA